jgi:hypothetical protein
MRTIPLDRRTPTLLPLLLVAGCLLLTAALLVFRPWSVEVTRAATDAGGTDAYVATTDGDLLHLIVDGTRSRIQQPRAATLAELEASGVTLGEEVEQLSVSLVPTGSSFLIVPPDGPNARLHLLVDGSLHPVRTRALPLVDLEAYPVAAELPFDRVAVAP